MVTFQLKLKCNHFFFKFIGLEEIFVNRQITYGYIRVSTAVQHEDRQRLAMADFGVEEQFIFADKQSGKDFQRPAYKELLKRIKIGDTLVVKSLDRLGRNYNEVLEQWRIITKEKGASIVILDDCVII